MEKITNILNFAILNKVTNINENINDVLKNKIRERFEMLKEEIAKSMFNDKLDEGLIDYHKYQDKLNELGGKVGAKRNTGILFVFNNPHKAKDFSNHVKSHGWDTEHVGDSVHVPNNIGTPRLKEDLETEQDLYENVESIFLYRTLTEEQIKGIYNTIKEQYGINTALKTILNLVENIENEYIENFVQDLFKNLSDEDFINYFIYNLNEEYDTDIDLFEDIQNLLNHYDISEELVNIILENIKNIFQLDEVSCGTLRSYIGKASDNRAQNAMQSSRIGKNNSFINDIHKRNNGIGMAMNKLAKKQLGY